MGLLRVFHAHTRENRAKNARQTLEMRVIQRNHEVASGMLTTRAGNDVAIVSFQISEL